MSSSDNGIANMQLPPGPLSHGDRGPAINAIQLLMILLATLAVALRFVARRMSVAGLWWDDWMVLMALIWSLGINTLNLIAVNRLGLGKHIWDVEDGGHGYLRSLFALELLYTTALVWGKLSVLLMYRRLFGIERNFSIAVNVVAGLVVAWWIGVEVATLLQCQPIRKFWNYEMPGQCFDIVKFFEGSAIPNVVTDLIILLLPQPLLWRLNMSKSNKIALCGIFLLGAFTAVSSIGRLVTIIDYHKGVDFTYDAFAAITWYSIEPAIGIICACLPCMGPLFRRLPGSPFVTSKYGTSSGTRGTGTLVSNARQSERRLSLDTASVRGLRPFESSCTTSIYASASESMDDLVPCGGLHELNVIQVRNSTHVTSPISPQ